MITALTAEAQATVITALTAEAQASRGLKPLSVRAQADRGVPPVFVVPEVEPRRALHTPRLTLHIIRREAVKVQVPLSADHKQVITPLDCTRSG